VRVWLTGASGLLGGWARAAFAAAGADLCTDRVELTDEAAVARAFAALSPDVVAHCAAMAAIADCAQDPARAHRVNVDATRTLARHCDATGARLVLVSTDLVFDGEAAPYAADAPTAPTTAYGTTKALAEAAALTCRRAVVVRVSLLFGPSRTARAGFFDQQLAALRAGRQITLFADEWRTPLSLRRAAEALVLLAASPDTGIVHLGGPERMSRLEMGERLAALLDVRAQRLIAASRTGVQGEPRPRDVSLVSSRVFAPLGPPRSFEEECQAMGVSRR
jgi:dTDP-4-dehydrorhamnose reductase